MSDPGHLDPVEASDALDDEVLRYVVVDRETLMVTRSQHRWLLAAVAFLVTLATVASTVALLVALQNRSRYLDIIETQREVIAARGDRLASLDDQIVGLKTQLAEQKQAAADLKYVLEKQAVPAILKMADQIEALGGKPPKIVLQPPEAKEKPQ